MDAREGDEVLRAGVRLTSVVAQLLHADDNLNNAAAVCLGNVAVPTPVATGVAQAQLRIQELIAELQCGGCCATSRSTRRAPPERE